MLVSVVPDGAACGEPDWCMRLGVTYAQTLHWASQVGQSDACPTLDAWTTIKSRLLAAADTTSVTATKDGRARTSTSLMMAEGDACVRGGSQ